MIATNQPASLTVAEVANELRCSEKTVRRLIKEGILHGVQATPGSRIFISRKRFDEFLEGAA